MLNRPSREGRRPDITAHTADLASHCGSALAATSRPPSCTRRSAVISAASSSKRPSGRPPALRGARLQPVPRVRSAGPRFRAAGMCRLPRRGAGPLLLQVARGVPVVQCAPGARHRHPPRGARASPERPTDSGRCRSRCPCASLWPGIPGFSPRCWASSSGRSSPSRRTASWLGVARPLTGAVAFVQRFGSALQLTPHFHVLVPEAVFEELDEAELRLHPLPRPTDREVEALAVTVARRTLALLRARRVLNEEAVPDRALDVLQLDGIQVPRGGPRPPTRRPGRRSAFARGLLAPRRHLAPRE